MGFLSMFGLVTAEEHNRIVAVERKQIADAAKAMEGEGFVGVPDHAARVGLVMARLRAARTRIDKAEQEAADLRIEIARLKPLAEATERRRQNEAKRVRPSRAKKGEAKTAPKAKPAAKAAGKGKSK